MKKKNIKIIILFLLVVVCIGAIYLSKKAKERKQENLEVKEEQDKIERMKYFEENQESMEEIVNELEKHVKGSGIEVSAYLVDGVLTLESQGDKVIENDKKLLDRLEKMLNNGIKTIAFDTQLGQLRCTFYLNSKNRYSESFQYNTTDKISTIFIKLKENWYFVRRGYE